MWQLIALNGIEPETFKRPLPAFPIFEHFKTATGSGWWNEGRIHISRVRPEHGAFIEKLQPYHLGDVNKSVLWALHELNNNDKHRLIQIVGTTSPAIGVFGSNDEAILAQLARNITWSGTFMIDGEELGKIRRSMLSVCRPEFMFTTEIAFQDGCSVVKNMRIVPVLEAMYDLVADIVNRFCNGFGPIPSELIERVALRVRNDVTKPPGAKTISIPGKIVSMEPPEADSPAASIEKE